MQKYTLISKVQKTIDATYYIADNNLTRQKVIIKKFKTKRNWQQLLNSPQIKFIKQSKYRFTPKIIEMIKQNDSFFLVCEPLNLNLQLMNDPLPQKMVIKIGYQILQFLAALDKQKIKIPYIKKQHFFLNHKSIKVSHIASNFDYEFQKNNLLVYDDYRFYPPQKLKQNNNTNKKSHLFSLGCILSELLLNNLLISANTKKEYVSEINKLFPNQKIQSILIQQKPSSINDMFSSRLSFIQNDFLKLLQDLMKIDQNKRISLQQAFIRMQHLNKKTSFVETHMENHLSHQKYLKRYSSLVKNASRKKILYTETQSIQLPRLRLFSQMQGNISKDNQYSQKKFQTKNKVKFIQKTEKKLRTALDTIQDIQIPPFLPKERNCCYYKRINNDRKTQRSRTLKKMQMKKQKKTIYANMNEIQDLKIHDYETYQ